MKNTTLSYLKTLIIISLFFAIGSAIAQPLSNRQVVEKIIGKVDNHVVLKSEMEVMYLQYMANNQFKFSNENIRCSVLESLLINKLLLALLIFPVL